ncbi:MAG: M20 family metallopeptidase [Cellulosilyticaceae bacterium]
MDIKESALAYEQYVVELRRAFHEIPELSFEEVKTSQRVQQELRGMGIPYEVVARTGVVASIKGDKPGRCVALRADMDALRVKECTGVSYASKHEGMMHACGHDGHMAMLLGAARVLSEMKEQIEGEVRLIFQPAEEPVKGAIKMIEGGALEGVDGIFGIHLWADIPAKKISIDYGPRMASSDIFKIVITGKGGHGSMPHQCVDAVMAASAVVMNLQSVVSRELNPLEPAVVTVGSFHAGTTFNVIGNEAVLTGTTRCFNPEIRKTFSDRLERIVHHTVESYRAEAKLEYSFGTPSVINEERCTKLARETVSKIWGVDELYPFERLTGGEDLAYYFEKVPGVLAFIGIKNEDKGIIYPHHHEKFDMDEEALVTGMTLYAAYALNFLSQ